MPTGRNDTPTHVASTTILPSSTTPDASASIATAREALPAKLAKTLSLLHNATDQDIVDTVQLMGLGSRSTLAAVGAIDLPPAGSGRCIALLPMMRELIGSLPHVTDPDSEIENERTELEQFIAQGSAQTTGTAPDSGRHSMTGDSATPAAAYLPDSQHVLVPGTGAGAHARHRHHPGSSPA